MKLRPIAFIAAAAAAALVLLPSAAPAEQPSVQHVLATLEACNPALLQAQRSATFTAQLEAIPGTQVMSVRFELLERRSPGGGFHPLAAPGFGVWHDSAAGVGIYRYSQQVSDLPAPAAFRVAVRYRWLNARHHVIRRARRVTQACVQPDERPHLVIKAITHRPTAKPGEERYAVVVRNSGLTAAGPFVIALSSGGTALGEVSLGGLAAGAREVVSVEGPACSPGSVVQAVADARGAIDQTTRADSTKTAGC
jgi:hypothetical protein